MYQTQVVDTFIDHAEHKPVTHDSEELARAYAKEVTSRKRSECRVCENGQILDIYTDGRALGETAS